MRHLLALVALAALVAACGGPRTVSLEELAFTPERYDDSEVVTSGVVMEFDEDDGALERHFVIQDTAANRVKLEPDDVAEPHVGSIVRVTGRFTFSETVGRVLQVEDIEPGGGG